MKPLGPLFKLTLALVALCSTLVMLADLFFGLIATDELPNLERLADYVTQAFAELESSVRDTHA